MSDLFNRAYKSELPDLYEILSEFDVVISRKKDSELFSPESGDYGEAYGFTMAFLGTGGFGFGLGSAEGEIGLDYSGNIVCLFKIRKIDDMLNDDSHKLALFDIYKIVHFAIACNTNRQTFQHSLYISGVFDDPKTDEVLMFSSRLPTEYGVSKLTVKEFLSEFFEKCKVYREEFKSNASIVKEYYL